MKHTTQSPPAQSHQSYSIFNQTLKIKIIPNLMFFLCSFVFNIQLLAYWWTYQSNKPSMARVNKMGIHTMDIVSAYNMLFRTNQYSINITKGRNRISLVTWISDIFSKIKSTTMSKCEGNCKYLWNIIIYRHQCCVKMMRVSFTDHIITEVMGLGKCIYSSIDQERQQQQCASISS